MSAASAPVEIGAVTLTVHDLPGMTAYYQRALGLDRLAGDAGEVTLGAGAEGFLTLRADPAARRRDPSEAGLFHNAFLLPSRAALGRWLHHAGSIGLRLEGASDHLVSEAVYLSDPEGNGIEVYADKPRSVWNGPDGKLKMATLRLDLQDVANGADAPWTGAPEGTVMGHVHLQVGDSAVAEGFFTGTLGMTKMADYPGAVFASSGGYHHHLAGNVWNSRGAARRAQPSTGLSLVTLRADPAAYDALCARLGGTVTADPWGTEFALARKA
jgi:catechol 2,3-dioxygenase